MGGTWVLIIVGTTAAVTIFLTVRDVRRDARGRS
ncbi:hypothetical protein SAMN05192558_109146 [Actinokineospora alba]|uniref:Uncharacterized protein n=1 Tax=Actinokineospora alba TaxID=504798 RepID=A0A1H0SXK6_9PSEU|nr:hypothetical protein C8E96_1998 [Actinokineospora alba]SDJ52869.1 hypothetical protein SAMN05421871_11858 [Actinokineospora alba]SDP46394.1 hypothetical protein SAMN05192558_109146 [Actinokineospora alba]